MSTKYCQINFPIYYLNDPSLNLLPLSTIFKPSFQKDQGTSTKKKGILPL